MRKRSDIRSYQERVITHLYDRDAAMAVLKMGAGKTASALTAIQELIRDGEIRHALVIAPKRVASLVWPDEVRQWEHLKGLRLKVLEGGPEARERALWVQDRHVTVCGIDNVQWLCGALAALDDDHPIFDLLVLDETSKFKDPTSKRGKALAKQAKRFRNRWGLTGTPTPNSLLDLWGPLRLIEPKIWPGSFYKWRQEWFRALDYRGYKWEPLDDTTTMAQASSIAITLHEDEMPGLPELTILVDEVTMPDDAVRRYREMESTLITGDIVADTAAIATGKLAQISNGFIYDTPAGVATHLHNAKREWLEDILDATQSESAIIVYEFLPDRDMILDVLKQRQPLRDKVVGVIGDRPGDTIASSAVREWNDGDLDYLVMHPASGGHGLNLQMGGSRMIWVSPPWSAELWEQSVARLHRPGQANHVMVHVCCAAGTVDHMKRARVIDKLDAQAAFEQYLRQAGVDREAA